MMQHDASEGLGKAARRTAGRRGNTVDILVSVAVLKNGLGLS